MVQIIPGNQRRSFAQSVMGGVAEGLPNAIDKYQQYQNMQAENQALSKRGIDLAGVREPATRQALIAHDLTLGRQMKQAQAQGNLNYSLDDTGMGQQQQPQQQQGLPSPRPKFSSKETGKRDMVQGGNLPQPGTAGQKYEILNPEQEIQRAQQRMQQKLARNIPTDFNQELQSVQAMNNSRRVFNQDVEADTEKSKVAQREYGVIAEDKLLKVLPNATDEMRDYFKGLGVEGAKTKKDEAAIERELSQKATDFSNMLDDIKTSIGKRKTSTELLGTGRKAESERNSMRVKLKPLLDLGFYDTARNLLENLDYGPEETESTITDLGEYSKKTVASLPDFKEKLTEGSKGLFPKDAWKNPLLFEAETFYDPQDVQTINNSILETLQNDPNTNLILLRKAFEDKHVNWKAFKDGLDAAVLEGGITLNRDQRKALDILDNPPLNGLQKILHGLGLRGR